jgi:hypothetical protein
MVGGPLPPPDKPFLNTQTGLINPEWYMALRGILRFIGSGIVAISGGAGILRSIVGGTGITVTDGDGVAGNPTISSTITQYTDEMAQDAVGGILTDTATIDFVYTDATPKIEASVKDGSITFAKMQAITDQRLLGSQGGTAVEEIAIGTGLTLAANTLSCSVTGYTNEEAQDAVGGILTGLAYNDSTPSISAIRVIQIQVSDPAGSAITTGDGKAYFRVNSQLNGYNLTAVAAALTTVSSSGIPTVQIHNLTQTADMLSTKLTIDQSETDSSTAATPAVIDTGNDDVATADMLRIDIDVAGTGAKGLIVELTFSLP